MTYSGRTRSPRIHGPLADRAGAVRVTHAETPSLRVRARCEHRGLDEPSSRAAGSKVGRCPRRTLDRRQPRRAPAERCALDGEADVLEVVRRERRRLEAREAVKAGHLAKAMHRDERPDASERRVASSGSQTRRSSVSACSSAWGAFSPIKRRRSRTARTRPCVGPRLRPRRVAPAVAPGCGRTPPRRR